MPHIRMIAPPHHLCISVDGIVYHMDADGEFDAHDAHKKALLAHGCTQKLQRATFVARPAPAEVAFQPLAPVEAAPEKVYLQENADQAPPALDDTGAADEPF